jgi:hypothetical protein
MLKPSVTPMGSHEFRTNGSSPGANWPSTTASVMLISIIAMREMAIGTDRRNKSIMSTSRTQAGQFMLRIGIPSARRHTPGCVSC